MKVYRVATGRTVAPFGDAVRDLFIGTRTVGDWQADAVRAVDLDLVDVDALGEVDTYPCIVVYDDVWFTEMAFRQFVADVMRAETSQQLVMQDEVVASVIEPLQDARTYDDGMGFDVFYCHQRFDSLEALVDDAEPSVIETKTMTTDVKLPPSSLGGEGRKKRESTVPVTARVVANVRHWIHLLKLSQLSIGVTILDRLRQEPRRLLRLRLSRSKDPWQVASQLQFIDPSARVHPTAHVESSVVGANVVIDAHAHVHRSVIGDGVRVGDHAAVMGCTLAENGHVLSASYLAHCAAMPDATLASYKVQLSLFGRSVFLTSSAWLIDAKLQGEIRVRAGDRLVPVGPFLGCCLGHRVTLGAQVALQAGRVVPNGLTIVGPPEHFLSDVEALPEGTVLAVQDGVARPVR